ncbi:MAG: vitamin B12-dependent ribonucleotide reductase [Candidatus Omnitrophica bacterium]|nr:vitamin B12-dependent ribonucleotide reductase [Candidatus Omnitrophota bacterium]
MPGNLSENAKRVLEKRYLKKDSDGKLAETADDMFQRVAINIAQAEKLYKKDADVEKIAEKFYSIMANLEFLPNSPTLMNAGRELQQLSACFVIPVDDSMESIFEAIKNTALIHRSGGGTGFSFSRLRPKGSRVRSTDGVSSGPISFMKVFNAATQAVKQGGRRRGANMGILRVDHPDILEFIFCKESDKEITNFNISVAVSEDFMQRVKNNQEYDLIDPHTKQIVDSLNAKEVFQKIVQMAWKNGEPGIIFLDRMNKYNPTPALGAYESTNPCGEQVLLPYESCNLGSINLSKMVMEAGVDGSTSSLGFARDDPEQAKRVEGSLKVDWDKLARITKVAVRFLDNVIDMNKYPLLKIEEMTKGNRKIGLGVMGFADMLINLGIAYNSQEAISLGHKAIDFILQKATSASCELARERGVFPNFEKSIYNVEGGPRLRNATLTTIAPTGTLSIIANCSSGIEPVFAIAYLRKVLDKEGLPEVHPIFEQIAKERNFYSAELIKMISQGESIQDLPEIPEDVRKIFVTSHDIIPEWHIRMQGAFQEFTNNAVSKTVNFPHDANVPDVEKVYTMAYELGCKGVTIYRDRSRQEQVLNLGKQEKVEGAEVFISVLPRPRPQVVIGTTTKVTTGCGNLYITINEDEQGRLFEVFMQIGKAGGCAASQLEAIGRLVSLALRSGVDLKSIIEQLRGIRCPSPSWSKEGRIFSCADAIARVIESRLSKKKEPGQVKEEAQEPSEQKVDTVATQVKIRNMVGVCPDCGGALRHEEGCVVCASPGCGYTRC